MESAKNPLLVLLIVALVKTAKETNAAYMYSVSTGICAIPSCHIEVDCHLSGAHDPNLPIEFYHNKRDGSVNGPLPGDTSKFNIHRYKPKLCTTGTRNGSLAMWDLRVRLTVYDASDSDAGNYSCVATIPGQDGTVDVAEKTISVWVQHDTEFEISASHLTMNLGDSATVSLDLKCDRTAAIEVSQATNKGLVRVLPYMYDHNLYPYVWKVDREFIIPNFSCDDEGNYTIAIYATRGVQLVKTTTVVRVEACEGCCNEEQPPSPNITEQPNEIPGSNSLANARSPPTYVPVIVVLLVISVLLNFVFGLLWYRQKRGLNRPNQGTDEDSGAGQSMRLQSTTLNDTVETSACLTEQSAN